HVRVPEAPGQLVRVPGSESGVPVPRRALDPDDRRWPARGPERGAGHGAGGLRLVDLVAVARAPAAPGPGAAGTRPRVLADRSRRDRPFGGEAAVRAGGAAVAAGAAGAGPAARGGRGSGPGGDPG